MSEHEELESSVAAWVLGAAEADEAETLRIHVEGCAGCRELADRLRRAVGALPLEVEEVAPPPRLRERVLAAAAASRSTSPAPVRARGKARQLPSPSRPLVLRLTDRVPVYAAAAAVLVALVAGLFAGDVVARRASPAPPSQVARFTLVGHQDLAGAKATVIDLKSDGLALVDFSGLPMLQSGKVYEVWLITGAGQVDPAGVFVPDSNGSKVVLVTKSLSGYAQVAITREAGPDGANAPTEQPEMSGALA